MLFDIFVTVIVTYVTTLLEIEVKKLVFIVKQFLDNECSIILETLEKKNGFVKNLVILARKLNKNWKKEFFDNLETSSFGINASRTFLISIPEAIPIYC